MRAGTASAGPGRVALIEAVGRGGWRRYRAFRRQSHLGQSGYCATAEFAFENLTRDKTAFARSCWTQPLLAVVDGSVQAECLLVHDQALPALQVAFFEAQVGAQSAVDALLGRAKAEARRRRLPRVIVGLDGHVSYGVGILTEGFEPASFGSPWNGPHRGGFFDRWRRQGLTAYSGSVADAVRLARLRTKRADSAGPVISVRGFDRRDWAGEMETFRRLCDATLGTTPFYAPTEHGHFADLLRGLKPFLRPENLLFALDGSQAVGFLFWHPDYNQVLPKGRRLTMAEIGWRLSCRAKSIDTAVVNAIGVVREYRGVATTALLARFADHLDGHFSRFETTFVWDVNQASTSLGHAFQARPRRRFAVWTQEVAP
ncbi:MAG: hypothetical protein LBG11_09155 [Bifidobacteriaceae bacterium]|nr:hypothetical protein [Bifidobacteriaceae bacterium]